MNLTVRKQRISRFYPASKSSRGMRVAARSTTSRLYVWDVPRILITLNRKEVDSELRFLPLLLSNPLKYAGQ